MENNSNRWTYDDVDILHYKKNKGDYYRFLIRVPDNKISDLIKFIYDRNENSIYQFGIPMFCKKKNDGSRNKTDVYEFDTKIMDFNNDKAREMIINHSVLICQKNTETKKLCIDMFRDNFNVKVKDNGNSITIQMDETIITRGVWKNLDGCETFSKYPIAILSYQRANQYGYTHKILTKMKIQHFLFVEPQDVKEYRNWYDSQYCAIIVSPVDFSKKNMGSSLMRNYILDYFGKMKLSEKVWMLDDNIKGYYRFFQGKKNLIESSQIFTSIEKYVERYDNVGVVSHNFNPFITENDDRCCIVKNCKCYSSLLISVRDDIYFDYKYEEDNIVSMLYLSKGLCNLSFNHILYDKDTSGANKGGNQVNLYNGDGYKQKYMYFYHVLNILHIEGKLKFKIKSMEKDGSCERFGVDDLLKKSTTMKSKDYHHKLDYSVLVPTYCEEQVDIEKKYDYDEIVAKQSYDSLIFIPTTIGEHNEPEPEPEM